MAKTTKEKWEERELQRRKDRLEGAKVFTADERKAYLEKCRRLREMIDDAVPAAVVKKEEDWLESLLK